MRTGRPVTNRNNYFSEHHHKMLIKLALQVKNRLSNVPNCNFWKNIEIDELVNVGWYRQARYYKSVKGMAAGIKREMWNWVKSELDRYMQETRDEMKPEVVINDYKYHDLMKKFTLKELMENAGITEENRKVVNAYIKTEKPLADIAEAMGIGKRNVRYHLTSSKRKMRKYAEMVA